MERVGEMGERRLLPHIKCMVIDGNYLWCDHVAVYTHVEL